jgi:hypothetical protein
MPLNVSQKPNSIAHLALISISIFEKEAGVNEIFAIALWLICFGRCNQSVDAFRRLCGILFFYEFSQAATRELVD